MRFQTVEPFGQCDLSVVVPVTVFGKLLAALPKLLDRCHHFSESLPFTTLPHFVLVLVEDHKAQRANPFVLGAPSVCVIQPVNQSQIESKSLKYTPSKILLPIIAIGCDELVLQEDFQVTQELHFSSIWTSLHGPRRRVDGIALRFLILCRSARDVLASVLVHAPTISGRPVALHAVVTTIGSAFGDVQGHFSVLEIGGILLLVFNRGALVNQPFALPGPHFYQRCNQILLRCCPGSGCHDLRSGPALSFLEALNWCETIWIRN